MDLALEDFIGALDIETPPIKTLLLDQIITLK